MCDFGPDGAGYASRILMGVRTIHGILMDNNKEMRSTVHLIRTVECECEIVSEFQSFLIKLFLLALTFMNLLPVKC